MPTYVVRFPGHSGRAFKGIVRHVSSGEESTFASSEELIRFITGMNAVHRWENPDQAIENRDEANDQQALEGNARKMSSEDTNQ